MPRWKCTVKVLVCSNKRNNLSFHYFFKTTTYSFTPDRLFLIASTPTKIFFSRWTRAIMTLLLLFLYIFFFSGSSLFASATTYHFPRKSVEVVICFPFSLSLFLVAAISTEIFQVCVVSFVLPHLTFQTTLAHLFSLIIITHRIVDISFQALFSTQIWCAIFISIVELRKRAKAHAGAIIISRMHIIKECMYCWSREEKNTRWMIEWNEWKLSVWVSIKYETDPQTRNLFCIIKWCGTSGEGRKIFIYKCLKVDFVSASSSHHFPMDHYY